ncbi:hypothetical protein V3C99_017964, partial [Haemonchus contortus]
MYPNIGDFHRTMIRNIVPTSCDRCLSRLTEISLLQTHRQAIVAWGEKLYRQDEEHKEQIAQVEKEMRSVQACIDQMEFVLNASTSAINREGSEVSQSSSVHNYIADDDRMDSPQMIYHNDEPGEIQPEAQDVQQ